MIARPIASLACPRLSIALADDVAGLPLPLPHAALLLVAVAEMRNVDLRQRNRHTARAFARHHLAVADVLAQVLFDLAADDLAETSMIEINFLTHRSPPKRLRLT